MRFVAESDKDLVLRVSGIRRPRALICPAFREIVIVGGMKALTRDSETRWNVLGVARSLLVLSSVVHARNAVNSVQNCRRNASTRHFDVDQG